MYVRVDGARLERGLMENILKVGRVVGRGQEVESKGVGRNKLLGREVVI